VPTPSLSPSLSIVVPARDEAENLPALAARIAAGLPDGDYPDGSYEVLIVDDHSLDGTEAVVAELAGRYPVRLVPRRGTRPGKGYALADGFAAARGGIVCMIDADLQYPPEAIAPMARMVRDGRADVVVAQRVRHGTTLRRRAISKLSSLLLRRLHGLAVDVQAGLKVMRREVLDDVPLAPSAWALDVGLLVGARAAGYAIAGHPIRFEARRAGRTKMRLGRATWEIAGDAVRRRVNWRCNLAELARAAGLRRREMAGSSEGPVAPSGDAGDDGITDARPPWRRPDRRRSSGAAGNAAQAGRLGADRGRC
jgi:glycosyltransferase involved in cell wall biosynthesis